MSYRKNVQRGIQILDEKVPNWRKDIRVEILEMSSENLCILGQLFGTYEYGLLKVLGINKALYSFHKQWIESNAYQTVIKHGFTTDLPFDEDREEEYYSQWEDLRDAWLDVLVVETN